MRSSRVSWRGVVVLTACSLTVAAVVMLQGDRPTSSTPETAETPKSTIDGVDTPGTAALRASIDPETGKLVLGHQPTSKADPELQNMLSRSTEGLVPVQHPDGSVSVNLQGRFQSASVARIDSSGKLHTTCVDSAENADAACRHLSSPAKEER
jgi:hypothetical protein